MINQLQRKQKKAHSEPIEYTKINAYTQKFSLQQILTISLFLIQLVMYNVFITTCIARQDSSILWIMFALTYILFVVIVADYIYLTCNDPVDDLLLGVDKGYKRSQMKQCKQGCNMLVHKSSYHCHTCNRCSIQFDHHCKYLNNCIGGKNYHSFFRLLVMVTAFCIDIIGQSIWVFVLAHNDDSFNSKIVSKWGIIATLIYTIAMLISVDTLLCFHCYLVLVLKKTTLEFLDPRTEDNGDSSKQIIQE